MGRLHPKAGHFLDLQSANGYYASSIATTTATTTTTTTTTSSSSSSSSSLQAYSYSTSYITPLRLAPREEHTRISLQKQRIQEHNHAKAFVNVPGLKTSAAFFTSLRTNLRLHASPPPSPTSTPPSMRASSSSLPPPSPLSGPVLVNSIDQVPQDTSLVPESPLLGLPELSSYLATEELERTEALKLVADSVAQQRQVANQALIRNPFNLTLLTTLLALVGKFLSDRGYDATVIGLTCIAIFVSGMLGARYLTQGYVSAAEAINFDWLGDADILVTKFGHEVIGAVVIEWVSGESRTKRKKAWRGLIRGWAVRWRYRGKGVGTAMLEDAVKQAKQKGAESLDFAQDHANSKRVLPRMYNSTFDKSEQMSIEKLRDLMESSPRGKGRRRLTN